METLVASVLLGAAMVPCLKAMTSAHTLSTSIERKSQSLAFAKAKMNDIRARSVYNYTNWFGCNSAVLSGRYLCTVDDTSRSSILRQIEVHVGYDLNNNKVLSESETLVTLETLVAKRW
jgi:hypothetical protein